MRVFGTRFRNGARISKIRDVTKNVCRRENRGAQEFLRDVNVLLVFIGLERKSVYQYSRLSSTWR